MSNAFSVLMRHDLIKAILLFLSLVLAASTGNAADALVKCTDATEANKQIQACSQYLRNNSGSNEDLATAYLNRGIAYAQTKRYAQAMDDFGRVVDLVPSNPMASGQGRVQAV
jgi:tetratricopeptide (TPR) repeat protein